MSRPAKVAKPSEPEIEDLARQWLAIDYLPQTKKVVQDLLDAGDKPVDDPPLPHRAVRDRDHALGESLTVNFPRGFVCVRMYYIHDVRLTKQPNVSQAMEKLLRKRLAFGTAGLRGPM